MQPGARVGIAFVSRPKRIPFFERFISGAEPAPALKANCNILAKTQNVKGHLSFPGTASRNDKWTAEDDRLAQLMEVFGPFPEAVRKGVRSREFFDNEGMQLSLFLNYVTPPWSRIQGYQLSRLT